MKFDNGTFETKMHSVCGKLQLTLVQIADTVANVGHFLNPVNLDGGREEI